jgi:hypothetical protein
LLHTLDFELPFSETSVVSAPRRALKILVWWKFYSFVFHNITFCIIVLSIISVSVICLSILDKYHCGSLYERPRFEQGRSNVASHGNLLPARKCCDYMSLGLQTSKPSPEAGSGLSADLFGPIVV